MLQAINDRIKGWLGIVIVVLIGLPFALWGIQSYFDDSGPRYAAKVNGVEISAAELEYNVSTQRQKLLRQFNGQLPFEEKVLREQVLNQLINQRLLEMVSFDEGYRISDPLLAASIRQQFTIDGQFDRARLDATLAAMGRTPQQYEYELRNELRIRQLQSAVANSGIVTDSAVSALAAIEEQLRDATIIIFSADKFTGDYQPSKEEVQQYYDENQQQFMVPEKIKVDYVELTTESIASDITIDENKIKEMYDDYVASVSNREERRASHILVTTGTDEAGKAAARARLEAAKKRLDEGASFSELAKEISEDPGSSEKGGDLEWVATGDMVKPFEDALFSMEKGAVSDIVETQFGLHLIKLVDVRSETIEPLSIKRYEFEEELRDEVAASLFYDLSENLANKAYENPDSLDDIVESMGVAIQTSDYFTRQQGKGIAENDKVRNIAFSKDVLEQGLNSDVIEITPKHIVVIRLNEYVDAMPIPVEVVTPRIEAALRTKSGFQKTMEVAMAAKAELESGADPQSLVAEGIVVEHPEPVMRRDFSKVTEPTLINEIFDMPVPVDGKPVIKNVTMLTGDVALIVLNKVITPETIAQEKKDAIKAELRQQLALEEFSALLNSMKANAKIEINSRVLK